MLSFKQEGDKWCLYANDVCLAEFDSIEDAANCLMAMLAYDQVLDQMEIDEPSGDETDDNELDINDQEVDTNDQVLTPDNSNGQPDDNSNQFRPMKKLLADPMLVNNLFDKAKVTDYQDVLLMMPYGQPNGLPQRMKMSEMIKQEGEKYVLYSKDGSKKLGEFDSKEQALKREKQILFIKHMKTQEARKKAGSKNDKSKNLNDGSATVSNQGDFGSNNYLESEILEAETEETEYLNWELTEEFLQEGYEVCGSSGLALADPGMKWSGSAARKAVRKWATGEDGKVDYSKYAKAFVLRQSGKTDILGSYKLPFATVVGNELKAVPAGIHAAGGVIRGAMGGVQADNIEGAKRFLGSYYKKLDAIPPWSPQHDSNKQIKESQSAPLKFEGAFLGITESATDFRGSEWDICIIREGWSLNGRYYPKDVLQRDMYKFEGVPIAIYGYDPQKSDLGHLPSSIRNIVPEGLADNTVGWVDNVYCKESNGRLEICGKFHCVDERIAGKLVTAWDHNKKDFLGFSIDAVGECKAGIVEGRRGYIVTEITHPHEVTLVNKPAAHGRLNRLVASIENISINDENASIKGEGNLMNESLKKLLARMGVKGDFNSNKELCEAAVSALINDENNKTYVTMAKKLMAGEKFDEAATILESVEVPEVKNEIEKLLEEARKYASQAKAEAETSTKLREEAQMNNCKALLESTLKSVNLPTLCEQQIVNQFKDRVFEEAELQEAIKGMRELAASLAPTTQISQTNGRDIQVGPDSVDKFSASLDLLFGFNPDKDKSLSEAQKEVYKSARMKRPSIRKLYEIFYNDPDLDFVVNKGALQESTTSDFTQMFGTSMERSLIQMYQEYPAVWRNIVYVNPNVTNFKTQTRILWGDFASLSTVPESTSVDTYTSAGTPREDSSTYSISTYGSMVTITRKMIINDDLNAMSLLPKKMAKASHNSLHNFVFKLLIGNTGGSGVNTDTMFDSQTIYSANHRNTGTTALAHSAFDSAIDRLLNQYGFGVSSTLNNSGTLSSGSTSVTVTSTEGLFNGDFIQIEGEILQIGTVASSTSLTGLSRGQLGTTAASHVDTTRFYQLAGPLNPQKFNVVVPINLRDALNRVLLSTKVSGTLNNDDNIFHAMYTSGQINPMVVPTAWLGGDVNNWYLVVDPEEIPCIELAFLNNRQEPEILVQDQPTVGNVFTRDNIRYKIRHEYGGVAMDYRGLDGSIVAG